MNNTRDNRQIRIFISSTFQDMQAERDYLITKVFPKIQELASERDVALLPLDLRWGITEDESKTGKVIQICLQEIENSHPFFIGVIGDRYGWCPTSEELLKNEILKERWGEWLEKDLEMGLSITEIEMQYGVLRSKNDINAYFFIKNCNDTTTGSSPKLDKLKTTIRNNGRYPVFEYNSPENLGLQVEQAFITLLDRLYPNKSLSRLQKDRLVQKSFLHSRIGTYIPEQKNYDVLNQYLNNDTQHYFVVVGESGMGKSSLIANWLMTIKDDIQRNIICHFIGNCHDDGDYQYIQERLINEICDLYQVTSPSDGTLKDKLIWLYSAISKKKPLLIVLDSINQLSSKDHAKLLNWLPIPTSNIKYIFSTVPTDSSMTTVERHKYPVFHLNPLSTSQKKELIINYLYSYRKSLTAGQVDRILSDSKTNNTFVLRTLLDELVVFGLHDKLDAYINSYLQTKDINEFFRQVLRRYEQNYGEQPVAEFLSIIMFSQKGVTEAELIAMTKAVPLVWSQFYCAFRSHLISNNGYISFSHQHMKDAIAKRYSRKEIVSRNLIIEFFKKERTPRAIEELAFQYAESHNYDALYKLLQNYASFETLLNNKTKLAYYWNLLLNTDSSKYTLSIYHDSRHIIDVNNPKKADYRVIGEFLLDYFGDKDDAIVCFKHAEMATNLCGALTNNITPQTIYRIASSTYNVNVALGYLNKLIQEYQTWKDDEQMDSLTVYGEDVWSYMVDSFVLNGMLLVKKEDFKQAVKSLDEALWIVSNFASDNITANCRVYSACATFLFDIGERKNSLDWAEKAYSLSRELPIEHLYSTSQYAIMLASCHEETLNGKYIPNIKQLEAEIKKILWNYWDESDEEYAYAMLSLGHIYKCVGLFEEAVEHISKALVLYENLFGGESSYTFKCYSLLGDVYKKILTSCNDIDVIIDSYNDSCKYYFIALSHIQDNQYELISETYHKMLELYCFVAKTSALDSNMFNVTKFFDDLLVLVNHINISSAEMIEKVGYENSKNKRIINEAKAMFYDKLNAIETEYYEQGECEIDNENYEDAILNFEKSINISTFLHGKDCDNIELQLSYIAFSYYHLCDYRNSLLYCKKALAVRPNDAASEDSNESEEDTIRERLLPVLLNQFSGLEDKHNEKQDYQAAIEYCLLQIDIYNLLNINETEHIAICHNNIGYYNSLLEKYYSAAEHYEISAKIYEDLNGYFNDKVSQEYFNAGKAYEKLGNYEKAIELYQMVLEIDEKILGNTHEYVIKDRKHLERVIQLEEEKNKKKSYYLKAETCSEDEDFIGAIENYKKVISEIEKEEYPSQSEIADCYEKIARLYLKIDEAQCAIDSYKMAMKCHKFERVSSEEARARILGYDTFEEAMSNIEILNRDFSEEYRCALLLAGTYTQSGQPDAALAQLDGMMSEFDNTEQDSEFHKIKGDAYLAKQAYNEAIDEYKTCYQISLETNHGNMSWTFDKLRLLQNAYVASGNLQEAISVASQICNYYEEDDYCSDDEALSAAYDLADLYFKNNDAENAIAIYIHVWEVFKEEYGDDEEDTAKAAFKVARLYEEIGDKKQALLFYVKILISINNVGITMDMLDDADPEEVKFFTEIDDGICRVINHSAHQNISNLGLNDMFAVLRNDISYLAVVKSQNGKIVNSGNLDKCISNYIFAYTNLCNANPEIKKVELSPFDFAMLVPFAMLEQIQTYSLQFIKVLISIKDIIGDKWEEVLDNLLDNDALLVIAESLSDNENLQLLLIEYVEFSIEYNEYLHIAQRLTSIWKNGDKQGYADELNAYVRRLEENHISHSLPHFNKDNVPNCLSVTDCAAETETYNNDDVTNDNVEITPNEMFSLGYNYYNGQNGNPKDYAQAVYWYEQAAQKGNAAAQCNLGLCYERGDGVQKDLAAAFKWYLKSAENGSRSGQVNVGISYENGEGTDKNPEQAAKWYRAAAEQGYASGQYEYARCLKNGLGVKANAVEAIEWYNKSAAQGNDKAMNILGDCYYKGEGVEKDILKAKEWYEKAAAKGNKYSIESLKKIEEESDNSLHCIKGQNGRYGYANAAGKVVRPCIWTYAKDFVDDVALVWDGKKMGAINRKGEFYFECKISCQTATYLGHNLINVYKGSLYSLYTLEGKDELMELFESLDDKFENGFVKAVKYRLFGKNKPGKIDTSGKFIPD